MSLYNYFKRQEGPGLPDPKGTLSSCLPQLLWLTQRWRSHLTLHNPNSWRKKGPTGSTVQRHMLLSGDMHLLMEYLLFQGTFRDSLSTMYLLAVLSIK